MCGRGHTEVGISRGYGVCAYTLGHRGIAFVTVLVQVAGVHMWPGWVGCVLGGMGVGEACHLDAHEDNLDSWEHELQL
jgi:hypothetical protein